MAFTARSRHSMQGLFPPLTLIMILSAVLATASDRHDTAQYGHSRHLGPAKRDPARFTAGTEHSDETARPETPVKRNTGGKAPKSGGTCISGLCFDVREYPADRINSVLQKSSSAVVNRFFDGADYMPPHINISNRFNEAEEMSLCESALQTIMPQKAKNLRDEERFIVNHGDHKQHVTIEKCMNLDSQCKFSQNFPNDYKSSCVQKFVEMKFFVLNGDKIEQDTFRIPSCCMCTVKKAM